MQPEGRAWVGGDVLAAERSDAVLDAVLAAMEERVIADGARILGTGAYEDDQLRIETILRRGYKEDRRSRRWELDLIANRERLLAMTERSRARMREEGVRILTLAEDRDPAVIEKVWHLSEEAGDDLPTTVPRVPEAMEAYVRRANAPEVHRDRFWIARVGDGVVGVSVLAYPPVRGIVGTNSTATARAVRGRGVARALTNETAAPARAPAVHRVRTGYGAAKTAIPD